MYPIQEQIIQNIEETLCRISSIGGFDNTLIVEREKKGGNEPLRNGLTVIMAGNCKYTDVQPVGFERKIIPVGICIYVIDVEGSDQPMDRLLYWMASDVRKALLRDVYRGDTAENTTFDTEDKIFTEGSPASILITCHCQFRHRQGDPYNR